MALLKGRPSSGSLVVPVSVRVSAVIGKRRTVGGEMNCLKTAPRAEYLGLLFVQSLCVTVSIPVWAQWKMSGMEGRQGPGGPATLGAKQTPQEKEKGFLQPHLVTCLTTPLRGPARPTVT